MLNQLAARLTVLATPRRQRGLTTVEYALAGGLIVVIVVAGLMLIGSNTSNSLNNVGNALK